MFPFRDASFYTQHARDAMNFDSVISICQGIQRNNFLKLTPNSLLLLIFPVMAHIPKQVYTIYCNSPDRCLQENGEQSATYSDTRLELGSGQTSLPLTSTAAHTGWTRRVRLGCFSLLCWTTCCWGIVFLHSVYSLRYRQLPLHILNT